MNLTSCADDWIEDATCWMRYKHSKWPWYVYFFSSSSSLEWNQKKKIVYNFFAQAKHTNEKKSKADSGAEKKKWQKLHTHFFFTFVRLPSHQERRQCFWITISFCLIIVWMCKAYKLKSHHHFNTRLFRSHYWVVGLFFFFALCLSLSDLFNCTFIEHIWHTR